jgi:hypothetical protein
MCLEKIKILKWHIAYLAIVSIVIVVTYNILGERSETFIIAISTIVLAAATIYLAYFNMKLWFAHDKPWLCSYHKLADNRSYIKNVGKGAALGLKFTVKFGGSPRYQHSIPALSPNEEYAVTESPESPVLDTKGNVMEYEIDEITYKDINGMTINQKLNKPIIIDLLTWMDTNNKPKI